GTAKRLSTPAHGVDGYAVGRDFFAHVLVAAHPAPRRHVHAGRGVVGGEREKLADADVVHVPGQLDDRQRAAPTTLVEGDHRSSSPLRRSATIPGSTARNRSTSAPVVSRCRETRTLPWESTPIASSTCDGVRVDEVHDDPLETAKPCRSSS